MANSCCPAGRRLSFGTMAPARATTREEKGECRLMLLRKLGSGRLTSSVRPPLQLQFEPPADPSAWHMTGRFNWPKLRTMGSSLTANG